MTAAVSAVLSLPVVAIAGGQPDGVGAGTDTAAPIVPPQANVPDSPPSQANGPRPAPQAAPPAQGESPKPGPPPGPPAEAPPAWTPGSAHARGTTPAQRAPSAEAPSVHPAPSAVAADDPPGSSAPEAGAERGAGELSPAGSPGGRDTGGATDLQTDGGAIAGAVRESSDPTDGDTTKLMPDASPATLPFTGLQLALMAMFGLAALAIGTALRRSARQRGT